MPAYGTRGQTASGQHLKISAQPACDGRCPTVERAHPKSGTMAAETGLRGAADNWFWPIGLILRRRAMGSVEQVKTMLRHLCLALMLITFGVGHYLSVQFWPQLFSYGIHYHPHLAWTLGWLIVFVAVPSASLGFVAAAVASDAWRKNFRVAARFLSACAATVVLALLFANEGDSFFFWICLVLPFATIHVAALLGFSAVMQTKQLAEPRPAHI